MGSNFKNLLVILFIFVLTFQYSEETEHKPKDLEYLGGILAEINNFENFKLGDYRKIELCTFKAPTGMEMGFRFSITPFRFLFCSRFEFLRWIYHREAPNYWVNRQMAEGGKLMMSDNISVWSNIDIYGNYNIIMSNK